MHAKAGESDRAIRTKMVRLFPFDCNQKVLTRLVLSTAQTSIRWQAEKWQD